MHCDALRLRVTVCLFVGCLRAFVGIAFFFLFQDNNNMMSMTMLLLLYLQTPQHFCVLLCFYTLLLYTHTHSHSHGHRSSGHAMSPMPP